MALALLPLLVAACGGDDDGPPDAAPDAEVDAGPHPHFPADFEQRYEELRDCRFSHEHELRYIRVFASPSAAESYRQLSPDAPYPVGANLVKSEYDDELCTDLREYTEMTKLDADSFPEGGDWLWQRIDPERRVTESGAPTRCTVCHKVHCAPPFGYDLSCAEEL
jgi:hypothetical protein